MCQYAIAAEYFVLTHFLLIHVVISLLDVTSYDKKCVQKLSNYDRYRLSQANVCQWKIMLSFDITTRVQLLNDKYSFPQGQVVTVANDVHSVIMMINI